MQFFPIPIVNLMSPAFCVPSLTQMISIALTADFKKYILAVALNELSQSQKDDKKSQNAETNILSSSLEEIVQQKREQKALKTTQNKSKQDISFLNQNNEEQKMGFNPPKKRQCYQKTRFQISQALQPLRKCEEKQNIDSKEQKQEQIIYEIGTEDNIFKIKAPISKYKKVRKQKKIGKIEIKQTSQPYTQILTTVSLIDTIDHPKTVIDRFQIQKKRQNLLSRAILYEQLYFRRYNYQIRERRQPKRQTDI